MRASSAFALGLVGPCALGAALAISRQRAREATTAPAVQADAAAASPREPAPDWCASGFEAIPGGGCLALSPENHAVHPLIVYLHGRYARTAAGEEGDRQRRLAARAASRGFSVLALRGRLGACSDAELADWYCWPSSERNADAAAAFVDAWAQALATAYERSGTRRPFLLGFSNGGYFAGLISSRGLVDAEAVVVAHGGPVEPVHALHGKPPILLLSADDDVAQDEMIRLDEELAREQWPHDSYARSGGHGLTDQDIDAALAFFSRSREALPLVPPLPLHRAIRHVRDAGLPDVGDWPLPPHDAPGELPAAPLDADAPGELPAAPLDADAPGDD